MIQGSDFSLRGGNQRGQLVQVATGGKPSLPNPTVTRFRSRYIELGVESVSLMPFPLTVAEVLDKEPNLFFIWLSHVLTAGLGYTLCRRNWRWVFAFLPLSIYPVWFGAVDLWDKSVGPHNSSGVEILLRRMASCDSAGRCRHVGGMLAWTP
jgi:hypothetical protein